MLAAEGQGSKNGRISTCNRDGRSQCESSREVQTLELLQVEEGKVKLEESVESCSTFSRLGSSVEKKEEQLSLIVFSFSSHE
jgi:hypothetical protein